MYIQEGTGRTVGISAMAWPLSPTRCRRMEIEEKGKLPSQNDEKSLHADYFDQLNH